MVISLKTVIYVNVMIDVDGVRVIVNKRSKEYVLNIFSLVLNIVFLVDFKMQIDSPTGSNLRKLKANCAKLKFLMLKT